MGGMRCFVVLGSVLLASVAVMLLPGCTRFSQGSDGSQPPLTANVGRDGTNRFYLPNGQLLTPAGRQIDLPGMRPQTLVLSPDQRLS